MAITHHFQLGTVQDKLGDRALRRRWGSSLLLMLGLHAATIWVLPHPTMPIETTEPPPVLIDMPPPVPPPPPKTEPAPPRPVVVERPPEPVARKTPKPVNAAPRQKTSSPRHATSAPRLPEAPEGIKSAISAPAPGPEPPQRDAQSGLSLPTRHPDEGDPKWEGLLLARLEKFKRYPRLAQIQHQEGVVHLAFAMDRAGKVLASRIERSSGSDLLDDEVLALIERAEPLPAPPPEMPGDPIRLTVPVKFSLR